MCIRDRTGGAQQTSSRAEKIKNFKRLNNYTVYVSMRSKELKAANPNLSFVNMAA